MLTQAELKKRLNYNSETGLFSWLIATSHSHKIGDIAGTMGKKKNYISIGINNKLYQAHRLAWLYMTGSWPENQIDHKDTIKSHNWWDNLREATNSQNKMNQGIRPDNTSGYKGVKFDSRRGKWTAQCNAEGKRNFLGSFDTPELASMARKEFAKQHHGEFYRD